jgi:hypothetical protein
VALLEQVPHHQVAELVDTALFRISDIGLEVQVAVPLEAIQLALDWFKRKVEMALPAVAVEAVVQRLQAQLQGVSV